MSARAAASSRSSLTLVVLALLFESPMHPYRMQKLIKERGQDKLVNVKSRQSIQQTVERLERDGLVASSGSTQSGRYPQRTIYTLTKDGRAELMGSLHRRLAQPADEYPLFPAALAFLAVTTPEAAAELLTERHSRLASELADLREATAAASTSLSRVFLIENDYAIAIKEAELNWLARTIAALNSGELSWNTQELIEAQPQDP
ncbi:PadR family transcriptional regulator [Tamaricihabitans halophyticus]|uniref:PadR family transcriptional regulator n=1 Tax=Tamaricihabitans halophyticus TaxID=1262583 RepID=A0A4R2QSC1_9PSEU|nr:helix-turn-helix transcriptional regulator [Tamaricihabitans halophyticus]TCP52014.1 PadR family transcriptional regulator [Tamaricihabitans halophyticus]